jgi:hypothetical protein
MKSARPHNKARPSASSSERDFKQLSLLPELPKLKFNPSWPSHGTKTEKALLELLSRNLTHIDWINKGQGWRLAASINELKDLGWEPIKNWTQSKSGAEIALYSLPPKAKRFAARILRQSKSRKGAA